MKNILAVRIIAIIVSVLAVIGVSVGTVIVVNNISWSLVTLYKIFFENNINSIPLLEKNTAILEVKYNDFLPDIIKQLINIGNLELTSFSKYSTGREMLEKIERRA